MIYPINNNEVATMKLQLQATEQTINKNNKQGSHKMIKRKKVNYKAVPVIHYAQPASIRYVFIKK